MGYRSEVAYVIRFKNETQLNTFVELVNHKGDDEMVKAMAETETKIKLNAAMIFFYTEDVKWYDSFPDVVAHHALMEYAVETFPDDAGWRFLRIGEDMDDNEIREDGECSQLYEYVDIQRSISIDIDI